MRSANSTNYTNLTKSSEPAGEPTTKNGVMTGSATLTFFH